MSTSGGVDQQFISCSQCHGLFTRRKTLLQHKSKCDGNPESSKCDYYAVPFPEYMAWKKGQTFTKPKPGKDIKMDRSCGEVEESVAHTSKVTKSLPKRQSIIAIKDNKHDESVSESPAKIPRKRGRPRKYPQPSETIKSSPVVSDTKNGKSTVKDITEGKSADETNTEVQNNLSDKDESQPEESVVLSDAQEEENLVESVKTVEDKEPCGLLKENDNVKSPPSIETPEKNVTVTLINNSDEEKVDESGSNESSSLQKESQNSNSEPDDIDKNGEEVNSEDPKPILVPWPVEVDDGNADSATVPAEVIEAVTDTEDGDDQTKQTVFMFRKSLNSNNNGNEAGDLVEVPEEITDENRPVYTKKIVDVRKRLVAGFFKCSICEYKTKLRGMFLRHMQSHNFGDRFTCDICCKIFIHRRHFNAHMMTHNRLQCPHCDKMYSRTHDRDRHVKNAHSDEKVLLTCSLCDFTTPYPGNFKEHQRKHTGERLFCTVPGCEYKTLYQRALRHHENSVHATSKDFKCTVCSYKSSTKLGLTKHMVTHSTVRDKQCPHCDYMAKTSGSLRAHIMKHGSDKYYYCDQCSYKTFRAHSFRNHMLIHLGLKPWNCGYCNFDAVTREKIQRHVISKHGGKSEDGSEIRRKDIRVKLNLEAFKRDPNNPEEAHDPTFYASSKMVMIEVINESGENVQANFSKHHQVILKDQENAEEVMEQSLTDLTDLTDQPQDIYKCGMCAFQADNLGEVEDHISECHASAVGEEIVVNMEENTIDAQFDITQENIEIEEATEQEVEEMVYVIAPGSGEEQSLIIQSKNEEIPNDAVYTAVESILHLQNVSEGASNTLVSN